MSHFSICNVQSKKENYHFHNFVIPEKKTFHCCTGRLRNQWITYEF